MGSVTHIVPKLPKKERARPAEGRRTPSLRQTLLVSGVWKQEGRPAGTGWGVLID